MLCVRVPAPATLAASLLSLCSHALLPSVLRGQEIIEAAKAGRIDLVRALTSADPDLLQVEDESGYTALRWAAIRGNGNVARFLVEAGSDPNSIGADGGTSLHGAAHHDDAQMMAALLAAGGDIKTQNRWGRTPLHVAARRGCLEIARLLLAAGADPDATTADGWSSLNVAYRGGHPELVNLLLDAGADTELADSGGRLPGEVTLERPPPVALSRRVLDEYVGHYDLGGGSGFDVWRVGDRMRLMEFAPDEMIPVAEDSFICAQEPWTVEFHRDDDGNVSRMEVSFLRRTVSARKIVDTSAGYTYVGSEVCFACHAGGPANGPAGHWIASRHSRAFHTLTTDQARALAASREDYTDITDPAGEPRCRMCHLTAAQNPDAVFKEDYDQRQGVGCEACHGPGSSY
ncbi:MAG: ankyrin repeat domain-containing protein, partial [Thermoanaerobaculia bacterium]